MIAKNVEWERDFFRIGRTAERERDLSELDEQQSEGERDILFQNWMNSTYGRSMAQHLPWPASTSEIPFSWLLSMRVASMLVAMLVLFWVLHFREGMGLLSDDLHLIRNAHPVLMLIGFILISGEAMLMRRAGFQVQMQRKAAYVVVQAMAMLFGVTGVWTAYKFHSDSGLGGFYSLHSWLGMICLLLFGIQSTASFMSLRCPCTGKLKEGQQISWHSFMELYTYGLAVAAAETGFLERLTFLQLSRTISRYSMEAFIVNGMGVILALLCGCVALCSLASNHYETDLRQV